MSTFIDRFPRVTPVITRISHDGIVACFVRLIDVGVNDFLANEFTYGTAKIHCTTRRRNTEIDSGKKSIIVFEILDFWIIIE